MHAATCMYRVLARSSSSTLPMYDTPDRIHPLIRGVLSSKLKNYNFGIVRNLKKLEYIFISKKLTISKIMTDDLTDDYIYILINDLYKSIV